jgi:hypothetical protein
VLPDEENRIGEELVWLRLVVDAHHPTPPEDDTVTRLQEDHLLADRGYVPECHPLTPQPEPGVDALAGRWREHCALVDRVSVEALAAIGADDPAEHRRTRRLVDGLLLATCLSWTTPEEAMATLEHHVAALEAAARVTA